MRVAQDKTTCTDEDFDAVACEVWEVTKVVGLATTSEETMILKRIAMNLT